MEDNLKYKNYIENSPQSIFIIDDKGNCLYANKASSVQVGYSIHELIDMNIINLIYPDENETATSLFVNLRNKGKLTTEGKLKKRNGEIINVIINAVKNEDQNYMVYCTDISEQKKIEKKITRLLKLKEAALEINTAIIELKNINELLQIVLEKIINALENKFIGCVLVLDENENLKIVASIGYNKKESACFCLKLKESFFWKKSNKELNKIVIINNIQSLDWTKYKKVLESEDEKKIESSLSTPVLLNNKLYGLINIDSEKNYAFDEFDAEVLEYLKKQLEIGISKYQLYEETILLSRYDKMTNVFNRRYFDELFNLCLSKAKRYNENFTIVIFDLNELKKVNDFYGHLAGDELIKNFASMLSKNMRESDILARIGGDEFVSIFIEISQKDIMKKIESIINKLKIKPLSYNGERIYYTFSYGMAHFPEDGDNYNILIKTADKNMYENKILTKNK